MELALGVIAFLMWVVLVVLVDIAISLRVHSGRSDEP